MNEDRNALLLSLMEPIGTDAPAGQEIECEMIYEHIRQAREEDDAVADDEWACELKVADWRRVNVLGCEVLKTHSKHFQVACWVAEAWVKQQGLDGLAKGIDLLERMVHLWWQSGFPALETDGEPYRLAMFGRLDRDISQWLLTHSMTGAPQCSLNWWQQVLRHEHAMQARSGELAIGTDDYSLECLRQWVMQALDEVQVRGLLEQIRHCRGRLQPFEDVLATALGGQSAGQMTKTLEKLEAWQAFAVRMLEWVAPEASHEVVVAQPQADAGRRTGKHQDQASMSRELAISQMQVIARFFRQQEPSSPVPMLMDRAVRWANMPLQAWLLEMVRDESCLREINLVLEGPQA